MNVKLGKYNQLEVVKEVDFGVYLDGGDDGEILLPTRYVPEGCKPGMGAQGIYPDGFGTDQGRCEGWCDERVGRFRGFGAFRYEAECG